jgi:hypothetical protein
LGLVVLGVATVYFGTRWIEARIVQMLEPYGQAEQVHVHFSAVVIEGLTLNAATSGQGRSPAHVAKVVIEPDWPALLARRFVLRTVSIDGFTLPARRTQDGKMQILPALTEKIKNEAHGGNDSAPKQVIEVSQIVFSNGTLNFLDAAIATPAHQILFDQMRATIGPCQFPPGTERTAIDLSARVVGKHKNGSVFIKGWFMLANKDTDLWMKLRDIEVSRVAPYLGKDAFTSLVEGSMALNMHLRVKKKYLNGEGNVALSDLRLSKRNSLFSLPRKAVLAALKDRQGKVSFDFSVQGQLDDPKFALEDSVSARVAGGLARAIGLSVQGVAEGATDVIKGLGGAFSDLLGQ